MVDHTQLGAGGIALHLLDSAQGNPVQTWRFAEASAVTIGRQADNDVVIPDPHISRLHARLVETDGKWMLISMGRHGTLVDDRVVAELVLGEGTVFRLGPSGPMMKFEAAAAPPTDHGETMDNVDPDMFSMLKVDEERKQADVNQIADNALFEELRQQSSKFKALRNDGKD